MPARDVYHDQMRAALVKDGWRITDDPLSLKWGVKDMYVDLGAEEILSAEKQGRKIAVEIKRFIGPSEMHDLEQALGQFILYRTAIPYLHGDMKCQSVFDRDNDRYLLLTQGWDGKRRARLAKYESLGKRFQPTEQMRQLAASGKGFFAG